MKRFKFIALLSLVAIVFFCSCSNESYCPTVPVDPPESRVDTVYVVVNDTIVDTMYVACDTCAFENCKTLGSRDHSVMWFNNDIMVVVDGDGDNPHAFGHGINICITMRLRDGEYNITLAAWRDKVKPNQTLNVYINGQHTVWSLGQQQYSTLQL